MEATAAHYQRVMEYLDWTSFPKPTDVPVSDAALLCEHKRTGRTIHFHTLLLGLAEEAHLRLR